MIVPRFWAESVRKGRVDDQQFTVRRFGWSDVSQDEAEGHAAARVAEAWPKIVSGEKLPRRERKAKYNGGDGLPIREEVVSQHGDTIITRNSYGAKCLNTPDVLFADIDLAERAETGLRYAGIAIFAVAFLLLLKKGPSASLIPASIGGAFVVFTVVASALEKRRGGPEGTALLRIRRFSEKNPAWRLRVYRTPAGFRVLALHRTFDPAEPEVENCFAALKTDPIYRRMCRNQRCFRARLTAKPWRIRIETHLRPRPGIWPIKPEQMPERQTWLAAYDQLAAAFSACRFVAELGGNEVDAKAEMVQRLHDEECGASSGRPLA